MLYRFSKLAVGVIHVLLLVLIVATFCGWLPFPPALGCMIASGIWLGITIIRLPRLLRSFEDRFARLQVGVPATFALAGAITGLVLARTLAPAMVALAELLGCGAVYSAYDLRSRQFIMQGHGPLPDDTWMCPETEAFQEGDLILTDGNMAARTHNSVGHVEVILRGPDGKLYAFSSYMGKGAVVHTLRSLIALERKMKQHYIVLRLRTPLTAEQNARAFEVAQQMLARNEAWRQETTESRTRLVNKVPMPAACRQWVLVKVLPDGYDWWGMYSGLIHHERWTCMGFSLAVLHAAGVEMRQYGTGLLGLGTGLLNPLMPIRLVRDPAYRLLRLADKEAFEASKAVAAAAKTPATATASGAEPA
jgi:hypothetical protein